MYAFREQDHNPTLYSTKYRAEIRWPATRRCGPRPTQFGIGLAGYNGRIGRWTIGEPGRDLRTTDAPFPLRGIGCLCTMPPHKTKAFA